jgi:hypothetical protein
VDAGERPQDNPAKRSMPLLPALAGAPRVVLNSPRGRPSDQQGASTGTGLLSFARASVTTFTCWPMSS